MYEHLHKDVIHAIELSKDDRINYIQSKRWIGYDIAKDIIRKMDDLLALPKSPRMPGLLIVGDSNAGKTTLGIRFKNTHPVIRLPDNEGIIVPSLYVQCPPVPVEKRLYINILIELGAPFKFSDSAEKLEYQAKTLMKKCNVKMLILDEIHSILTGPIDKQRMFLSVIRNLINDLKIPIVVMGTKAALNAIRADDQLENRFKPHVIPRWKNGKDFRRLLASFERMLPLKKPSKLSQIEISNLLMSMSEGLIGELDEVLTLAAIEAVNSEKEFIDIKLLANIDWLPPTLRKKKK